ncbi:MAG: TVP38/TMEM64 family protein [Vicinamibacterales bacterium]
MKRALLLVLGVVAVIAGSKFLIENVLGLSLEGWLRAEMAHAGAGAAIAVIGLLAVDIVLPVPSSLVMVLSGAAFGTTGGTAVALVGSIGGEWLGFELARRFGRRATSRLMADADLDELDGLFRSHGALAVMLTRALPVFMETMSLVAGLSAMPRRTFLWASLAGTAPVALAYAYAGAVARESGNLLPAAIFLVAITGLGWVVYRARVRR